MVLKIDKTIELYLNYWIKFSIVMLLRVKTMLYLFWWHSKVLGIFTQKRTSFWWPLIFEDKYLKANVAYFTIMKFWQSCHFVSKCLSVFFRCHLLIRGRPQVSLSHFQLRGKFQAFQKQEQRRTGSTLHNRCSGTLCWEKVILSENAEICLEFSTSKQFLLAWHIILCN